MFRRIRYYWYILGLCFLGGGFFSFYSEWSYSQHPLFQPLGHCQGKARIRADEDPIIQFLGRLKETAQQDICRVKKIELALEKRSSFLYPFCGENYESLSCFQEVMEQVHEKTPFSPSGHYAAFKLLHQWISNRYQSETNRTIEELLDRVSGNFSILHHVQFKFDHRKYWPNLSQKELDSFPENFWKMVNQAHGLTQISQVVRTLFSEEKDELVESKMAFISYKVFFDSIYFVIINHSYEVLNYLKSIVDHQSFSSPLKKRWDSLQKELGMILVPFIDHYSKYCKEGIGENCYQLGEILWRGDQKEKAKEALLTGCSSHFGQSCSRLAQIYREDKDHVKALEHFTLGCIHGYMNSCLEGAMEAWFLGKVKRSLELTSSQCEGGEQSKNPSFICYFHDILQESGREKKIDEIENIDGEWKGKYLCPQGETNVTLVVDGNKRAFFKFSFQDQKQGGFHMKWEKEGKRYLLTPEVSYIIDPSSTQMKNWSTISFFLDPITRTQLVGTIQSPGCSSIWLSKVSKVSSKVSRTPK